MKAWLLIAALQLVALAVIANRYMQNDSSSSPGQQQCGLLGATEYVITSRNVVLPEGVQPAAVRVTNGTISGIALLTGAASQANLAAAAALKFGLKFILDYGDLLISPGLIDTHVHFNEPGREAWEGYLSGTKAAAAGGTTTVIVMPLNAHPAIVTKSLLLKTISASKDKLWVDTGFWGGIVPMNANNHSILAGMLDAGALGFKSFMSPAGIDDFGTVLEKDIVAALPFLRQQGVPYYVHAELVDETTLQGDVRSHKSWENARPPHWERNAIKLLLDHVKQSVPEAQPGFSIHIAHLSDTGSLPAIQAAKQQGFPISVETCPHYLNFASEEVPKGGTLYKCAPPLRGSSNKEALWQGLEDNIIDSLASDHSPCPAEMKMLDTGDFSTAWGGIAGLQYNLPATWSGMQQRGLGPELLSKLWSAAPARLAGMDSRKGRIAEGLDADFVVWDPSELADTSLGFLQHRNKLTPYRDQKLAGYVVATFVRGQQVFSNSSSLSASACGRIVRRAKQDARISTPSLR